MYRYERQLMPVWKLAAYALCVAVISSSAAFANNGKVAIADSVTGIVADGDFSDWPQGLHRYPVQCNHFGDARLDESDFAAWYQVGYDLATEKLFVALEVTDSSHVLKTPSAIEAWNSRDGAGVYLRLDHGDSGRAVDQSFAIHGDEVVPSNWGIAAVERKENVHRYEWEFSLGDSPLGTNGLDYSQPFTAAFCVEAIDMDEDGSHSIRYWSPMAWKTQRASHVGDLVVGARPNQLGTVRVVVLSETNVLGVGDRNTADAAVGFGAVIVRYASQSNPNLVVDVLSDSKGDASIQLPAGKYLRTVPSNSIFSSQVISVAAGSTTDDDVTPNRPVPRAMAFGEGQVSVVKKPVHSLLYDVRNPDVGYGERRFTDANGFPGVYAEDIAFDDKGFTWLATSMGLTRIGGQNTLTFGKAHGLPSESITRLLYESDDEFWVGTQEGLVCISFSNESMHSIPGLAGKWVYGLSRLHDGRLGVATNQGLYAIGARVECLLPLNESSEPRCLSLHADPSGDFTWVGTDSGVSKFDGQRFTEHLTREDGVPDGRVWAICPDNRGGIWFGANRSLFRYDGRKFTTVRSTPSENYRHCSSLAVDLQGLVWAASYRVDLEEKQTCIVAYDPSNIESPVFEFGTEANTCAIGPAGNIWIGGLGFVSQIDLGRKLIDDVSCSAVAQSRDEFVWYGTAEKDGFFLNRKPVEEEVDSETLRIPCPSKINCLLPHRFQRDSVWVGTESRGLFLWDGATLESVDVARENSHGETTLAPNDLGHRTSTKPVQVFDLLYLRSGQLWVATGRGISVIRNGTVENRYGMHTGLPVSRFVGLDQCPDGNVVCASMAGVLFLDSETGTLVRRLGVEEGLPEAFVSKVRVLTDDTIWIGTHQGLYSLLGDKLTPFAAADGTSTGGVREILEGAYGRIWVCSKSRIAKICPRIGVVQTIFDSSNRDYQKEFTGLTLSERAAWISSTNGLVRCSEGTFRPQLAVQSIETSGPQDIGQPVVAYTNTPTLRVKLRAFSPSTDQDEFVYCYRTIGLDDQWNTSSQPLIEFATPPVGKYALEVGVLDRDLSPSELLKVDYEVRPPYADLARTGIVYLSFMVCACLGLFYVVKSKRLNAELEKRVRQRTKEMRAAHTEKESLHAELLQAQKLESLGTMAAGMAHDFNNTLCAIVSNAELGLMMLHNRDRVRSSLQEVVAASEQAAGLTRSLLTFAGRSSASRHPVRLERIVADGVKMIRGTIPATVQVKLDLPTSPIWCDVDEGQVKQVLINLAVNAIDAMPSGGSLKVEVKTASAEEGDEASLRVSDSGTGMSGDVIAHIFEPFYTNKPRGKGTGLGLSIVHTIVTAHGGRIVVDSNPSEGTTFDVRLPLCSTPALIGYGSQDANASPSTFPELGTIIVADDEARVRKTLVNAISTMRMEVRGVSDGQELVEVAEEQAESLALVVADVDMPKLTGVDALLQLREMDPDLPAIVITGMPGPIPPEAYDGPTVLLRKPFSLRELLGEAQRLARPVNRSSVP